MAVFLCFSVKKVIEYCELFIYIECKEHSYICITAQSYIIILTIILIIWNSTDTLLFKRARNVRRTPNSSEPEWHKKSTIISKESECKVDVCLKIQTALLMYVPLW